MGNVVLTGLLVVAASTGCGRYGFESDHNDVTADADPTPRLLTCNLAPKFSIGATTVKDFAAVPTSYGFALFSVDSTNELHGWAYAWNGDSLKHTDDRTIALNVTGAFGAEAIGDEIVVTAVTDMPVATTYHLLDAQLAMRADPVSAVGRVVGAWPISRAGTTLELASVRYESNDVAVYAIDTHGTDGATRMLGAAAEVPSELVIAPSGTGYAVAWVDTAATPNQAKLALLDKNFNLVKGPVAIASGSAFDTIRPRIRWAPLSNTYGVTWYEKNAGGGDDTYAAVFDSSLAPKFAPIMVMPNAVRPKIATDGTGFWIGYLNGALNRMDVARMTVDGSLAVRAAASGGGVPKAFGIVERAGQPVLVTVEESGGSQLYFDPLCP